MEAAGLEVAEDLCLKDAIEPIDGLDFNHSSFGDDEIQVVVAHDSAFVANGDADLSGELHSLKEQLDCECLLVRALTEPRAQGAMYFDSAFDDLFGDVDWAIHGTAGCKWSAVSACFEARTKAVTCAPAMEFLQRCGSILVRNLQRALRASAYVRGVTSKGSSSVFLRVSVLN